MQRSLYKGEVTAIFTACVAGKQDLFITSDIVGIFRQALRRACARHDCVALLYCFMPDHLHVALRGKTPDSETWKAVVLFKQLTGYWLARHRPAFRWQGDFYDRVVRTDEELGTELEYIAHNPVRRGIVAAWQDYPFTGSDVLDLRD